MSNSTENRSDDRGSRGSSRNRSQGGSRNRNRNNSNSNSRNGRQSGGGPRNRNGGGSGRSQSESIENRSETPKAQPLTFWQKILKAVGLYKESPAPRARRPQKKFDEQQKPRKTNTRVAKSDNGGDRKRKPRQVPNPDNVTGNRLYVGNLSFDASESDLEELFNGAGKVRGVDIVYNRATHRSKGYGFVEMNHLDEAKRAVEVLHDQPFMGRTLIVNEANSKGPDEGGDNDSAENDNNEQRSDEQQN